ncbi:response regulator receiver domain [Sphingobacterium siyangense]|uniref:response regulator receiver domain n=1 Tax=Sphingobacterium siyangense TaxID=459529 RepID=UPI003DA5CAB9
MRNSAFFNDSKKIADDFIQSIVFLDDSVYNREIGEDNQIHDLDASQVSKIFFKRKKICAIYDPKNLSDIDDFKYIANKADVIVLDWKIVLDDDSIQVENDDEDDAFDQTIRGTFTKPIIKEIVEANPDGLKIILVYTGETDLFTITREIGDSLSNSIVSEGECSVELKNIKILVRAKSNNQEGDDPRFVHVPGLRNKVLKYSDLPDFLISEFTRMTEGLLSNFILKSLSTIRNNTSKILGLYTKDLDHAFLEHKASIPVQDDADQLLVEIFKDSIGDLLHYKKIHKYLNKEQIKNWVTAHLKVQEITAKKEDGNSLGKVFRRDGELVLNLLYSENKNVTNRLTEIFAQIIGSKESAKKYLKYLERNNIDLFINESQHDQKENMLLNFAKLTHHKNLFLPKGTKPFLTLGTVIKSSKTDFYYICIQQKCDSVRLEESKERKFLFLPLMISQNNVFNFVTNDHVKLKLETKSYNLRTLKFKGNQFGIVEPRRKKEKYIFEQIYKTKEDEKFEWVLDLKDLHAQRIVADFASNLSRVGLDESEWLRKSGLN